MILYIYKKREREEREDLINEEQIINGKTIILRNFVAITLATNYINMYVNTIV